MAEFATLQETDSRYGKKGVATAGLVTGIVGSAIGLGLLGNNGCGCNRGGILGNILGMNNNEGCGCCCDAKLMALQQGNLAENLSWSNRVKSMEDDADLYTVVDGRINRTNERIGNEVQTLTNQIWETRVQGMTDDFQNYARSVERDNNVNAKIDANRINDLQEKFEIYARGVDQNKTLSDRISANEVQGKDDKFFLYSQSTQADAALDNKFTKLNYEGRIQDLNEKFDLYTRLNNKITDLEKAQAKTETALPLMFELSKVNSERYTDACCCSSEKNLLIATNGLQRQLDHKIDGELKYAYSNLCAPVPSISPLYCTPFTSNGSGTTWTGCCQNSGCQSL